NPTKVIAHTCVDTASGMATSAAIAIAALGAESKICARIGDDSLGTRYLEGTEARGVDTSLVQIIHGARTAISSVIVDSAGERLICPYFDPELWERTAPDFRASLTVDGSVRGVLVDMRWPAGASECLIAARHLGVVGLLDADIAPPQLYDDLVPLASHVVFSREALLAYSGMETISDALSWTRDHTDAWVGVTLGANGCAFNDEGGIAHQPALPVTAVDTLAAGDVFHGAFLLRLTERARPLDAVRFATVAAALKCEKFGGNLGAPSRREVEVRMRELSLPRPWSDHDATQP
ncbi:MAG: sugar kinase, partial [Gammaproteobacteria bacterium]|nr:sugar kinase [Gammaproteobacteria bacterium]